MTSEQWWAALLNGTVGAALSLTGVFLVFWLTRRGERKRNARAEVLRGTAQVVERSMKVGSYPSGWEEEEALGAVVESLLLFFLHNYSEYPKISEWALRQSSNLVTLSSGDADIRAGKGYVAEMTSLLMSWAPSDFRPNSIEEGAGITAQEIDATWLPADKDSTVRVTKRELANATSEVAEKVRKLGVRVDPELLPSVD